MSFIHETTKKARKAHQCQACKGSVTVGEPYVRWVGTNDGSVSSSAYHVDCRQWEIHLCRINGLLHDEWMTLDEHVAGGGLDALEGAPEEVRRRFTKV